PDPEPEKPDPEPENPDPDPEEPGEEPEKPDPTDPPNPDDLDIGDPNLKPDTDGEAENPFPDLIPDVTPDNGDSDGGSTVTQSTSKPDNPVTTTRVETLAKEVSASAATPSNGRAITNAASEGFLPKTGAARSGVLGILGTSLMTIVGAFGYKRRK
ncbi:LPXTG cell wall anchor domain-containing protein, partial [Companilactobacillus nantensis]